MSSSAPDTFSSTPGNVRLPNPATGITYILGFGPVGGDGITPTVIWVVVSTWAIAKARLGPTWADAKARATTWGMAKAVASS
jgi:hypothetical protein